MVKPLKKWSEFLFPTQIVAGDIPDFDEHSDNIIKVFS